MGEVYRALDTRLDRIVAVKILSAAIDTPAARERFDREARAVSSLNGPNICTLFDVGNQDGFYIAAPMAGGSSWSTRCPNRSLRP